MNAGRDLDLLVAGKDLVFAQALAAGQRADLAIIPIDQHVHRVKAVGGRVDSAHEHGIAMGVGGSLFSCARGVHISHVPMRAA